MILWTVAVLAIFVAWYALVGRMWLKCRSWAKPFFDVVEPIEIALWRKSETLLWARFKMLVALLITSLSTVGAIDVAPFLAFIPERHRWWVMAVPPAALALDGVIQEIQRRYTTKPLALVAIEENKLPPNVREVVEQADAMKKMAVEVVKDAKEEGKA